MKSIVLIITIIIVWSCNLNRTNQLDTINVDLRNKSVRISSFVDKVTIIPLETNSNCLISQITKVQIENEKVYVFDMQKNTILIFRKDGSFDKKLQRVGNGPDEYIHLTDFCVDNTNIYAMDFTKQTILKYDKDLKLVSKIKYATLGSQLMVKENHIWIYNEPTGQKDDYQFICIDSKGTEIGKYLLRPAVLPTFNMGGINVFTSNSNHLATSPRYGEDIYFLEKGELSPQFRISFGEYSFPEDKNISDYNIADPHFTYTLKHNFYLFNSLLVFDYIHRGSRGFCFYNLKNRKSSSGEVDNDLIKNFRFFPRWGTDGSLVEEISPALLIESFPSVISSNTSLNKIEAEDNPILIVYTLKK